MNPCLSCYDSSFAYDLRPHSISTRLPLGLALLRSGNDAQNTLRPQTVSSRQKCTCAHSLYASKPVSRTGGESDLSCGLHGASPCHEPCCSTTAKLDMAMEFQQCPGFTQAESFPVIVAHGAGRCTRTQGRIVGARECKLSEKNTLRKATENVARASFHSIRTQTACNPSTACRNFADRVSGGQHV
jgi:hypothetical protein